MATRMLALFALALSWAAPAYGQDQESGTAPASRARHSIMISLGYMAHTTDVATVTTGSGATVTGSSHAAGWIGYGYRFGEAWALQVEVGWIAARAEVTAGVPGASVEASAVTPVLVGVKYSPGSDTRAQVRPFGAIMAGPYVGHLSRSGSQLVEARTSTTFGARVGVGADVYVNRRIRFAPELRYHLVDTFEWPAGLRDDYSGLEFSLNFAVLVGRAG
jgi:hypothetical protein